MRTKDVRKRSCLIGGAISLIDRGETMKSKKTTIFLVALATICLFVFLGASQTFAATVAWDGGPLGTGTAWGTAANWYGDILPANGDTVNIIADASHSWTVNYAGNANLNTLTLEGSGANTSTFNETGSTFGVTTFNINAGGIFTHSTGGNFTATTINLYTNGSFANAWNLDTTNFNILGGAASNTKALSAGTIDLQSGSFTQSGSGTLTLGTAFKQSGGTSNFNSFPAVGNGKTVTLSGGTLTAPSIALSGTGNFNQTGGTLNATAFNQSGGTVQGTLQNFSGGTFTYTGGTFSGRLLNEGTVDLSAANFTADNGMDNRSTISLSKTGTARTVTLNGLGLSNSGSLTIGDNYTLNATTINNTGTFSRTGTTGTLGFTTINQNNGTFNTGTGTLSTLTVGTGKTINLAGGTLTAPQIDLSGTGIFTKSGGTLKATTAFTQSGGTSSFDALTLDSSNVLAYSLTGGSMSATAVNLNLGGTYSQTSGTATSITDFNYNGGAITQTSGTGISNITNFNYYTGTLPTFSSRLALTNFNQMAGSLNFGTLTLPAAAANGGYSKYSLQGGTLGSTTVNLNTGGTYNQGSAGTANITDFNFSGGSITQAVGTPSGDVGKSKITNFNYSTGTLPSTWDRLAISNFYQMAGNPGFTSLTIPAPTASGGYSNYYLQGGTLNPTTITLNSGGSFKQTAGTLTYTTFDQNDGTADFLSASPLNISGSQIYNLRGGELKAGSVANSGAFNFSGGTMTSALTNSGTATVSGLGTRTVSGAVTNTGTFDIQTAFAITPPNTYTQSTGLTKLNGTMTADLVKIEGGTLTGTGTLMKVAGNYTQTGGTLDIRISSLSLYDQLVVTGVATLGGTLNVLVGGGYSSPIVGDTFKVLTYGSHGLTQFASILGDPDGLGPLYFNPVYGATDLTLNVASAVVPIPASVWLLASGVIGMVAVRRRIRKREEGRSLLG
jgi:hypothetical protein